MRWKLILVSVQFFFLLYTKYSIAQINHPINRQVTPENVQHFEPVTTRMVDSEVSPFPAQPINNSTNVSTAKGGSNKRSATTISVGCLYLDNAQYAALSASDLIAYLKSTNDYECLERILINYDPTNSPVIFTQAKIQAVAAELKNTAPQYDGTNAVGVYGLLSYLRVASYFDFYYNSKSAISQTSWNAMRLATDALAINIHLFDVTTDAASVLDQFLILLDSPGLRSSPFTINLVKAIMKKMVDHSWESAPSIDIVTVYWRIFFLMFRGGSDVDYVNKISLDDEYISLLGGVSTDAHIMNNEDVNYVWQNNAVLTLANMMSNALLMNKVAPYLAFVCNTFPRLHINWLKAVVAINDAGKCASFNLCESKAALNKELMNVLFPNIYSYNDGNFLVRGKFMKDVSDKLYYATRQAEAQFFRLVQTDQPVTGDINTRLTCFVFDSKKTYDTYAPYLYGITTNNGGMYIESGATFYTWDRPITNSLSLEELFRHEYNHYLQGRFLIPGDWGSSPFYDNNRLTWYEEGHAEFLAGATDVEGIKLLRHTADRVKRDYPNWPSLASVFGSQYGENTAIYYPYGNLLWYYWYKNDYSKIKTFNDLTRSNNVSGFEKLVNDIKSSVAYETQWQSFLMDVYNGVVPSQTPGTTMIDDPNLTVGTINDISAEFASITSISNATATADATGNIKRFRISGTITGSGVSANNTEAAKSVIQALDLLMIKLKTNPYINNFACATGYTTNVSFANGVPIADYSIIGSLRSSSVGDDPHADFSAIKRNILAGNSVDFKSTSTGYIKGYAWSFAGGTPSTSNLASPTIAFKKAGAFEVRLTTTDKNAAIANTKTVSGYINVYPPSSQNYCSASHQYDFSSISRVKLNDIENITSGFPNNGYSDFTSLVTPLTRGSTYSINVDLSFTNSSSIGIAAWIDLNQNGSFSDSGEQLLLAHPNPMTQLTGASITIPSNALTGTTRMRIRATYNGESISPCGIDNYMGEIEDYSVTIIKIDTEAPSAPSNLIASSIASKSFTLTWRASTDNVGVAGYDIILNGVLKGSTSATTFDVNGLTPNTNYSVAVRAKDISENVSTESVVLQVSTLSSSVYCAASQGYNYSWISGVSLNTINNPTNGFPPNGYSDFTSIVTSLSKGSTYPIHVDLSFTNSPTMGISVWIDLNQNGSFKDSDEQVLLAHPGTLTQLTGASITIPSNALEGTTRMRIRATYNGTAISPCDADSYMGEVEDYSVTIVGNQKSSRTTNNESFGEGLRSIQHEQTLRASLEQSFALFPNPGRGSFTLQFENKFSGEIAVVLQDVIGGRCLKEFTINKSSPKITHEVHVETVPRGIYRVIMKTNNFSISKLIALE